MSVEALFIDGPMDRTRTVLSEPHWEVLFPKIEVWPPPAWSGRPDGYDLPDPPPATYRYSRLDSRPTPTGTVIYVWDPTPDDDQRMVGVPK